jgi:excisionase family DNA binding protein
MSDLRPDRTEMGCDGPRLLTLNQVAERLQVSLSDVRRKVRTGVLPCVRLGPHQVRVLISDLESYIDAQRRPPRSSGGEKAS